MQGPKLKSWKTDGACESDNYLSDLKCKKMKGIETIDDPHQYFLKSTLNRGLGGPETSQHRYKAIQGHLVLLLSAVAPLISWNWDT